MSGRVPRGSAREAGGCWLAFSFGWFAGRERKPKDQVGNIFRSLELS